MIREKKLQFPLSHPFTNSLRAETAANLRMIGRAPVSPVILNHAKTTVKTRKQLVNHTFAFSSGDFYYGKKSHLLEIYR